MNIHTVNRNTDRPASITRSLDVIKRYGYPVSAAFYILHNQWTLKEEQRNIFNTYYILHWSGSFFHSSLKEGTVEREGKVYQVIYYRTTPQEIRKHTGQVLLSFRELRAEYNCYPTVLVTLG